ncbi:hypothetical protein CWE15_06995 [Aliidiomarina taiwanensis]|uniref:Methyltransferase type 11 domain-containing protein n=1 Tax=Aliidiomarina taiwanensis TaxID=946228 RepID=A0A432X1Q4_9GAMM|nr:methyltransferase domain-containing protein [Aliidiomarina taiwanensis]RUO40496.1 hypothetical protein CWE15_06995 [Aliidiomarina taiwanensis]
MILKSARRQHMQADGVQAPERWYDIEQGTWWRQALGQWLAEEDPIIFGEYMLTLSGLDVPWPDARIKAHFHIHPGSQSDVQAELTALPITQDAIDWVALPFVLEYSNDPHQVLREADRALRNDGYMLVAMSNPYALHSLARLWPSWRQRAPWQSRLFTPARVLDWLSLLNYQVLHAGYFGYAVPWPSRHGGSPKGQGLLKRVPFLAAGYAMIVQKREWPVTLVRSPSFQPAQVKNKGVVPAGRIQSNKVHPK